MLGWSKLFLWNQVHCVEKNRLAAKMGETDNKIRLPVLLEMLALIEWQVYKCYRAFNVSLCRSVMLHSMIAKKSAALMIGV